MLPVLVRCVSACGVTFHCATPYATPRENAACFGAMSVGVLSDSSLWIHPYTTPRVNADCFGAMRVSVLSDSSLCFHLYATPRVNTACFMAISVSVLGDFTLCSPSTLHIG